MLLKDQVQLSKAEENDLIQKNLIHLIYVTSLFENLSISFQQTEAIVNDYQLNDVKATDIEKVLSLKRSYQFVLEHSGHPEFGDIKRINQIVQNYIDSAGEIRKVNVQVPLTTDMWLPPIPDEKQVQHSINNILKNSDSVTESAIRVNLFLSRWQLFIDGNKRTAIIFANLIMAEKGAGIIAIPENKMHWYSSQLAKYYRSGTEDGIKEWMYQNCIFGISK